MGERPVNKVLYILIFFLCLLNFRSQAATDTIRILWIGSSSTYMHDLPLQTAEALESYFKRPVKASLAGRSGTGFHEYLEKGFEAQYGLKEGQHLLEKIKDEPYDYVVLQLITYFIGDHLRAETEESTSVLVKAIREAGAEPVFYEMGWRLGPENEIGRRRIAEAAAQHGIKHYGACSSAWKKVRAEKKELALHNLPDTDHPGTFGTYLNISAMYTAFTGKKMKAKNLALEIWPRFGTFDKEEASRKLSDRVLGDYHQGLPGWLQKISVMRQPVTIDKQTAKYLNKVAYKSWRDIRKEYRLY